MNCILRLQFAVVLQNNNLKTETMFTRIRFSAAFILVLFTGLLFTACRSAQKMTESGDYDDAIEFSVQKLRGKSKKKTELVKGLEIAFQKAQARDMRIAEHLAAANRPENWEKINNIHRKIRDRQERVSPLLPLVSKDGYRARFEFVRIEKLELESREKAADYLYTRAEDLMLRADQGDRMAARDAYSLLQDLERRYFRDYKNKDRMMDDARALGTTHILFEVKNQSNKVLPRAFQDRVLSMGTYDLNSEWKSFHFQPESGIPTDYRVVFNIRQVDISPERINEREYVDEKEIQDGWEYVLDERGNVKKDTAGNDIKKPRFVCIRAVVLEAYQTKAARLTGVLEVYDAARNMRLDSRDLGAEILFEHYAATFRGDARALSEQSRRIIGNRPIPFPQDEDMLVQAADRLKPGIRAELSNSRAIY